MAIVQEGPPQINDEGFGRQQSVMRDMYDKLNNFP